MPETYRKLDTYEKYVGFCHAFARQPIDFKTWLLHQLAAERRLEQERAKEN